MNRVLEAEAGPLSLLITSRVWGSRFPAKRIRGGFGSTRSPISEKTTGLYEDENGRHLGIIIFRRVSHFLINASNLVIIWLFFCVEGPLLMRLSPVNTISNGAVMASCFGTHQVTAVDHGAEQLKHRA